MGNAGKKRKPNAPLGYLKAVGMLLTMLCLLPVWLIRGAATRARFRAELRAAGMSEQAARTLSAKYKLRLADLRRMARA